MTARHLLHPLRAARALQSKISAHLHIASFAYHGRRRFRRDNRYNLEHVSIGFLSRLDTRNDDKSILARICDAYCAAVQELTKAQGAPTTDWSSGSSDPRLSRVRQALLARDLPALAQMYGNFYRDACSSGLLGAPGGLAKAYFSGNISDLYRHFYLSHVLYRLDYWKEITRGRYPLQALRGPGIGNPFGVVIEGIHVSVGAEYAHYCAQRVMEQLDRDDATVVEIGGGFGGIAYYLLRDRPGTRYIDIDIPEYLALAAYYLMKAFPHLNVLLYREGALSRESLSKADIVLVPRAALSQLPPDCADLTYTSHGMATLSSAATRQCMHGVSRITRKRLFFISNRGPAANISGIIQDQEARFELKETSESGWHSHKISGAGVGGATMREASTLVEQSYDRSDHPTASQSARS